MVIEYRDTIIKKEIKIKKIFCEILYCTTDNVFLI